MTPFLKKEEANKTRKWYQIDATGKTLGRLASEIANILRGKHKTSFTPNVDCGDGVIVINAEKVKVTGTKEAQKIYRHYTGWIAGMRETPYRVMQQRKPEYIITHAVKGMVPRNKLGRAQMKKLRVFAGDKHKMQSQKSIPVGI